MQTYRYNSALRRALIVDIEAGRKLMVVNKLNGRKTTITLSTSLKSLRFRLLDQQNKRFVSFKEIKHLVDTKKSRMNLNNKRPNLDKN